MVTILNFIFHVSLLALGVYLVKFLIAQSHLKVAQGKLNASVDRLNDLKKERDYLETKTN